MKGYKGKEKGGREGEGREGEGIQKGGRERGGRERGYKGSKKRVENGRKDEAEDRHVFLHVSTCMQSSVCLLYTHMYIQYVHH